MSVHSVNSLNIEKNNNITFGEKQEQKGKSKKVKALQTAATLAGAAAIGVVGYKKNWAQKTIKWISVRKWMKNKVFPNYEIDDAKFMSMIGVTSIVLKDGLGCYFYVNQSLHNEKIPEDKRKFVAALDLANGGLMILMQLLLFFTISNRKVQDKIFDKLFGKNFTRSANKALQDKLRQLDKLQNMTGKDFHKAREADKKGLKNAFSYITSLAAATLIGKRIIVPFIATPLADKTEKWMNRNNKAVEVHKDTKNTYDTSKPAANQIEDKATQSAGKQGSKTTTNLLEECRLKAEKK